MTRDQVTAYEAELGDLGWLISADPERVSGLLDGAGDAAARLTAAVYRASQHLHRDVSAGPT